MCSKLFESSTCEKLAGSELKSATVSNITENGKAEKHMFHLTDAFDV